jgi:hypothetical protein
MPLPDVAAGAFITYLLLRPEKARAEDADGQILLPAPAPTNGQRQEVIVKTVGGGLEFRGPVKVFPSRLLTEASTTYRPDTLLDCRRARRVVFIVRNSTDQNLTVQLIADSGNNPYARITIGSGQTASSNDDMALIPVLDDYWHPWIGVTVATGGIAPTSGQVEVLGYTQE